VFALGKNMKCTSGDRLNNAIPCAIKPNSVINNRHVGSGFPPGAHAATVKTNITLNSDYKIKANTQQNLNYKFGSKHNNQPTGPIQNGTELAVSPYGSAVSPYGSADQRSEGPTYQRPPGIQTLQVPGVPGGSQGGRPVVSTAARRGNNVAASKRTRFALQVKIKIKFFKKKMFVSEVVKFMGNYWHDFVTQ